MENIKIPTPLQIVMDDFGWFCGKNELATGGPARTAISRDHVEEDYRVLEELGRQLNMKLVCGFTLGEWDKDNRLRGMKHVTREEDAWDRKSTIDMEKARRFFRIIEESKHVDIAFHGLMHSYWIDGENYGNPREFYSYDLPEGATERRLDYPLIPANAEYVDSHLAAWFDIYNGWGFTKPVKVFISPAGLHRDREKALAYAEKIEKYGILYWKNSWQDFHGMMANFSSLIFLNDDYELIDFDAIDFDPDTLPDWPLCSAVFGTHWPNFLRSDPRKNFDYLDKWVNYFKRQSEIFGRIISKDMAFAATQAQFQEYTKTDFTDNCLTLDIRDVYNQGSKGLQNEFYISIKDLTPTACLGGEIALYETHKNFTTYKLIPNNRQEIKIMF